MPENEYDAWDHPLRSRWWGEPWPSAELRAPICEDDRLRIPVPVGEHCLMCDEAIVQTDRGTAMMGVQTDESVKRVYGHQECMLRNVMGCSANLEGRGHDHQYETPGWYRQDARRVVEIMQRWA